MTAAAPSRWPRLMRLGVAAEYCGLSPERFKATVKVEALEIGSARMWDRDALDRWVDSLSQPEQHERQGWLDRLGSDEDDRARRQ